MNTSRSQVELADILNGRFIFDSETIVSTKSKFEDDLWDFTDQSKLRLNSIIRSKLCIDWEMYSSETLDIYLDDHRGSRLPLQMINELKVFTFIYLKFPRVIGNRGVQSVKPSTVVATIRALVCLLSDVLKRYQVFDLDDGVIQSITDISLSDIHHVLADSTFVNGNRLRKGLKLLASPVMLKTYTKGELQWNVNDIKALHFKFDKKRTNYNPVMPDDLFRFLSNSACANVIGFLKFIGQEPFDKAAIFSLPEFSNRVTSGANMFSDYVKLRQDDREFLFRTGKKNTGPSSLAVKFKKNYGVSRSEFFDWLYLVQRASFTIVGLYTGARYSDLTTFTNKCIKTVHGVHFLAGTVVKNKRIGAKENVDLWPAIPIMRDAVICLQFISEVTFNPYLISGSSTVAIGDIARAYSLNGFTNAINSYLREIDINDRWIEWNISAHQLRHSIARQLANADVGLIFISHQMKHLYTALNALPSNATMMYGNLGDLVTQRALNLKAAYLEVTKELYSPERPVAGGGAETFIAKRKAYFEGMAAEGWTVEEVIENLAKQALPFTSVGIGYCGGRRETILKDGTKEAPPCIGSLQCNPVTCSQAIITKVHEPTWKKIYEHNKMLAADPKMAFSKESSLAKMNEAELVLNKLTSKNGGSL